MRQKRKERKEGKEISDAIHLRFLVFHWLNRGVFIKKSAAARHKSCLKTVVNRWIYIADAKLLCQAHSFRSWDTTCVFQAGNMFQIRRLSLPDDETRARASIEGAIFRATLGDLQLYQGKFRRIYLHLRNKTSTSPLKRTLRPSEHALGLNVTVIGLRGAQTFNLIRRHTIKHPGRFLLPRTLRISGQIFCNSWKNAAWHIHDKNQDDCAFHALRIGVYLTVWLKGWFSVRLIDSERGSTRPWTSDTSQGPF
jgi:hypothetical protein